MTYEESVAYLSGLVQFGPRLGRERLVELLSRLGDPHRGLRCFHVAGTNGKGSTTTFLASALRAAGYRVGAYLSPYVFDLRERVMLDGAMISRDDFARHVAEIRPHVEAIAATDLGQTTEFELKTVVAFKHFAEQKVDFAVLEVGIGGRLDATNVIPPPLVAVVTSIGWDHTNLLGDTLAKIAAEKAGIVKRGTLACVTAVPSGEALDAIAEKASAEGVPLWRVVPAGEAPAPLPSATFAVRDPAAGRVALNVPGYGERELTLRLRGAFQAANAAVASSAIAAANAAGAVSVPPDALWRGLEGAVLPGRFQIPWDGKDGAPALVLDVAHNSDASRVLADSLRQTFGPGRRYVFVVGLSRAHDAGPFLKELRDALPLHRVVATAPGFRPKPAAETADAARALGMPVEVVEPAADAIGRTYAAASTGEVVVVTGSFYTVGETPVGLRK